MNKADALLLVQILTTMKEILAKLDSYSKTKDAVRFEGAKKELARLQQKIDSLL